MSPTGGQWLDKLVGSCFTILLAAIALYCAVAIIKPILPTLITIVGVLAILALLFGVVVVIRTWRGRW